MSDEGSDPSLLWDCDDRLGIGSRVGEGADEGGGEGGNDTIVCDPETEGEAKGKIILICISRKRK